MNFEKFEFSRQKWPKIASNMQQKSRRFFWLIINHSVNFNLIKIGLRIREKKVFDTAFILLPVTTYTGPQVHN